MPMLKTRVRRVAALGMTLAATGVLAACGGDDDAPANAGSAGGAAEGPSVTLNVGYVFASGSPWDDGMKHFAELAKEATGGKVTIKTFPDSQIGADAEMATAMKAGNQDGALLNTGLSGFGDRVVLPNLPYLVQSYEAADKLNYGDGFLAEFERETMADNGLETLEFFEQGYRQLSNKDRVVRVPADVKGLKVRTGNSQLITDIWSNWGAKPVSVPLGELYTGLSQGTVDGTETGLQLFNDLKLDEVQKHITIIDYVYSAPALVFSKKSWDKLSADQQTALREAAVEASVQQRKLLRAEVPKSLEALKGKGVTVTEPTPDELAQWRDSSVAILDKYEKVFGAETMQQLRDAVKQAEQGT